MFDDSSLTEPNSNQNWLCSCRPRVARGDLVSPVQNTSHLLSGPTILEEGQIDIWWIRLDRISSVVRSLFDEMSLDEKERARKFHFAKDRDHFVVARGYLRRIIGGYLDLDPCALRFSYNHYGKPFLELEYSSLRFNVSHSRELALVAITLDREIGTDIEFVDDNLDIFQVAQGVFSPAELSQLASIPATIQHMAFFRAWTRLEACLKAQGIGLSGRTDQFASSVFSGERSTSFWTDESQGILEWSLMSLPPVDDHIAAIAVQGKIRAVRYWELTAKGSVRSVIPLSDHLAGTVDEINQR